MKILMVNKFHYVVGGSETYYFALKKQLEKAGHTVIDFSMADDRNYPSAYSAYFVRNVDYNGGSSVREKLRMARNIVYSVEAKQKFEALVQAEKPDLVHLHLFQHQMSPSILDVIKKYRIPTVYTAHDLKMVCLNYKMMHHGKICEDCRDGHIYHCLKNRCVKESLGKSAINFAEGCLQRARKSYDAIDVVITPSAFYKKKMEAFGVAPERIVHIPNFLDAEKPKVNVLPDSKAYYLYFGRLSEEKGIVTLIDAVKGQNVRLKIVGSGPLGDAIGQKVAAEKIENVSLLGFRSGQELTDLVGNARAVILPSEWYENGPYSAIEALQLGRPILGAQIGGIPELVDGNGFLFPPGDREALRNQILKMEALDGADYAAMEQRSEALFDKEYTWFSHIVRLEKAYDRAIQAKKGAQK